MVVNAPPGRSQAAGVLNAELIIITVGSRGGGLLLNHAGGRYTSSWRWVKCDASASIFTGTTTPLVGLVPSICIAVTRSRSTWSGSSPDVSWFQALSTVGK